MAMIVDCHTHVWAHPRQLGRAGAGRTGATPAEHARALPPADRALVLGFRSVLLEADVPNDVVASYVREHPGTLCGIAAVDPTEPTAAEEARELLTRREFRGLTLSPALQGFHPADSRAMRVYQVAADAKVPVFLEGGPDLPADARLEFARPVLLDEIAREFPDLRIVIGSLGHPWVQECLTLLGKHPQLLGDVAGLLRRPWHAYNALVSAHQFGVIDQLLFGSDFPRATAAQAIEAVYRLREMTQGTNFPSVPRETLRTMIERDALAVLGIARPGETAPPANDDENDELD